MATGQYNITNLGIALKTVYDDKITNLITEQSYLLTRLEKKDAEEYRGGKGYEWLVKVEANSSYGVRRNDGGDLPDPGRRKDVMANTDIQDFWSSTGLTKKAQQRAEKGPKAFYSVIQTSVDETVTDLRTKVNHQLYVPPLWAVTADSTGTTITLASTQYVQVGDVIEVGNRTTGAGAAERTVTGKDNDASTITVNTAITVTAANSGAWYPDQGPTDNNYLDNLYTASQKTRTLHGIDSALYPTWSGNTKDMTGGPVDEEDVSDLFAVIKERGQGKVTDAITTPGIQRRIARTMQSQRQFVNEGAVTLKGGFEALFVDGKPIVAEDDAPKGMFYAFDSGTMKAVKGDYGWEKEPGTENIWRARINPATGRYTTGYMASYELELNVLFNKPGAVGSLTRCQDDKPPVGV